VRLLTSPIVYKFELIEMASAWEGDYPNSEKFLFISGGIGGNLTILFPFWLDLETLDIFESGLITEIPLSCLELDFEEV